MLILLKKKVSMTLEAYFSHDATAASNKQMIILIQEESPK